MKLRVNPILLLVIHRPEIIVGMERARSLALFAEEVIAATDERMGFERSGEQAARVVDVLFFHIL